MKKFGVLLAAASVAGAITALSLRGGDDAPRTAGDLGGLETEVLGGRNLGEGLAVLLLGHVVSLSYAGTNRIRFRGCFSGARSVAGAAPCPDPSHRASRRPAL